MQDLEETWGRRGGVSEGQRSLLRALQLGVGVHHSGLDKRYRQAVEMLFRSKTLQASMLVCWLLIISSYYSWQLCSPSPCTAVHYAC